MRRNEGAPDVHTAQAGLRGVWVWILGQIRGPQVSHNYQLSLSGMICTALSTRKIAFDDGRKETEVVLISPCLMCVNLRPAPRYLFTVLLTVWMTKNDTVNLTCLSLILYNFLPEIIQSLLLSAACIRSSLTDSNQSVCLASRS